MKLPARASFWGIISGLVARGVGVVGTPIFTRLLTPAEYGLFPLYTTWLSVASSVITVGITGSAIYRGLQRHKENIDGFISATLGLSLFVSLVAILVGGIFSSTISRLSGLSPAVLAMLGGEVLLSSVISVRSARLRFEYRYKELAAINIISAVGTPLISVLFATLSPYRAEARILGSLIMTAIIALPQLSVLSRGGKLYNTDVWRYLARVNLPLIPHYLSTSLLLRISEMVIGRTHGRAALARYSVAISVGLALTVVTNALGQVISPWILRKISAKEFDRIRRTLTLTLAGLLSLSLMLLSVAPELIRIITTAEYIDALPAVYPLALSVGGMFISSAVTSGEVYYERGARTTLPSVITAILSSGAALLILPRVDYRFSALFTLLSYILLATLQCTVFKRLSQRSIVDGKRCAAIYAVSIVYALLLLLLREVPLSRLLLAIAILPILLYLAGKIWREIKEA